jgi:hypothetical protein
MANEDTTTLEVTAEEGAFINMGLALLLQMLGDDIDRVANLKKEHHMEKLFFLMDTKMGVGSLWRKVLVTMGADPDDIANHLREQE